MSLFMTFKLYYFWTAHSWKKTFKIQTSQGWKIFGCHFRLASGDIPEDISDAVVKKLIVVTPANLTSTKRQFDRTGDHTSRSKMSHSLSEEIDLGLRRFEDDLWKKSEYSV